MWNWHKRRVGRLRVSLIRPNCCACPALIPRAMPCASVGLGAEGQTLPWFPRSIEGRGSWVATSHQVSPITLWVLEAAVCQDFAKIWFLFMQLLWLSSGPAQSKEAESFKPLLLHLLINCLDSASDTHRRRGQGGSRKWNQGHLWVSAFQIIQGQVIGIYYFLIF
jgi:hypothetical protein